MKKFITSLAASATLLLSACSSTEPAAYPYEIPDVAIVVDSSNIEMFNAVDTFHLVSSDTPAETLLSGEASLAISRHKWSDKTLADFVKSYGERPKMTILSATAPESEERRNDMLTGTTPLDEPWYLYSNLATTTDSQERLRALLAYLYSNQGQERLSAAGLLALPPAMQHRAQVQLGLKDAKFEGGYR